MEYVVLEVGTVGGSVSASSMDGRDPAGGLIFPSSPSSSTRWRSLRILLGVKGAGEMRRPVLRPQ